MGKIVIVGSSNTDLVVRAHKIPAPGETVVGNDYFMNPGGKGANQAVTIAKLGAEASFIAKVGDDDYGSRSIENYKRANLDVSHVYVDENAHSGVALIVVDDSGENAITVSSGANNKLCKEDIDQAKPLIESAEIVLMQLEIPMKVVEYVADMAFAKGVKVILNPAPAAKLSKALLSKLYLIIPNETECEILTGIRITDQESKIKAAGRLLDSGVKNVILTIGSKGSSLVNSEGCFNVPAILQKAVDTTAAGDVYCGALCVAISEGSALPEAMQFATAASSISVTRPGAQASIPSREEVESLLSRNKLDITNN
jgi:ribokinase